MSSKVPIRHQHPQSPRALISPPHRHTPLRGEPAATAAYLPGVEMVGCGYDVFGAYASPDATTLQLFDWSAAGTEPVSWDEKKVIPLTLEAQKVSRFDYNKVVGESVEKYQQELSAKVSLEGSYGFFSGSIAVEYAENSTYEASSAFTRIQQNVAEWSLKVRLLERETLRKYLRPEIRSRLDELFGAGGAVNEEKATRFFNDLGTHFLSGVIMGARATFSSSTDKVSVSKQFSLEVTAEEAYKAATAQVSAEEKAKYEQAVSSFNSSSQVVRVFVGGDPILASRVLTDGKKGFDDWVATARTAPQFIEFTDKNALTPMWVLCQTEEQSAGLKAEFAKYAQAASDSLAIHADYLDELIVIHGDSSTIEPPAGYTKIPYDLNAGAGGDFIYVCFHKARWPGVFKPAPRGVGELKIIYGKDAQPPPGFIKIDVDLNRGAGGEFVYLCYRLIEYDNAEVIKDIVVIGGGSSDVNPPYGYTKIPDDLNAGAGGEFVYLCYSKTV